MRGSGRQQDLKGHTPGGRRGERVGQEGDRDLVNERSGKAERPSRPTASWTSVSPVVRRRPGGRDVPPGSEATSSHGSTVVTERRPMTQAAPRSHAVSMRSRIAPEPVAQDVDEDGVEVATASGSRPRGCRARSRAATRGSGASTSTPPTSSASSTVRRPASRKPRSPKRLERSRNRLNHRHDGSPRCRHAMQAPPPLRQPGSRAHRDSPVTKSSRKRLSEVSKTAWRPPRTKSPREAA